MLPIEKIAEECAGFGINLDNLTKERLDRYASLLLEWNQKMNLTAITQPEEIAELAESMRLGQQQQQRQFRYVFLDCITRLYIADFEHNSCCVDSIEIPEGARRYMQRQTQVLRQASEWERGTVFAEVEAQLEQI